MNRFASFFTKKIFIISLVFDLPISLIFTYRHTSLRRMPFFSTPSLRVFTSFLVFDYIIVLLIFFILFLLSTTKRNSK